MILLLGATGAVGFEIAKQLSAAGLSARAIARSDAAATKLAALPHITPVLADLDNPGSLATTLEGITRAFLLTNSTERAETQQRAFVAAAARAGVGHVVKLSQLHADAASPVRFLRYHAEVEEMIRESDMDFTFLRPNLFMQGFLSMAPMIRDNGMIFAPIGAARISLVDLRDIAALGFAALTEAGHAGKVYDITGPEALSHTEIAEQIGTATGRAVTFAEIPAEAMLRAVLKIGFPLWQAEGLIEDYAHYARGEAAAISPDVSEVTGRAPIPFGQFLADHQSLFTPI